MIFIFISAPHMIRRQKKLFWWIDGDQFNLFDQSTGQTCRSILKLLTSRSTEGIMVVYGLVIYCILLLHLTSVSGGRYRSKSPDLALRCRGVHLTAHINCLWYSIICHINGEPSVSHSCKKLSLDYLEDMLMYEPRATVN